MNFTVNLVMLNILENITILTDFSPFWVVLFVIVLSLSFKKKTVKII